MHNEKKVITSKEDLAYFGCGYGWGQSAKGGYSTPKATDKKLRESAPCLMYSTSTYLCTAWFHMWTEKKADCMPSHNLEIKADTETRKGYEIEAESSSKNLTMELCCRLWPSAKLSSRLCKRASWWLHNPPGHTIPKVRSQGKGCEVSCWQRWLE